MTHLRKIVHVGGDKVIWKNILQSLEPVCRQLVDHLPPAGARPFDNHMTASHAVSRDHEKHLPEVVKIFVLSSFEQGDAREFGFAGNRKKGTFQIFAARMIHSDYLSLFPAGQTTCRCCQRENNYDGVATMSLGENSKSLCSLLIS
jgi:hypothetical protein